MFRYSEKKFAREVIKALLALKPGSQPKYFPEKSLVVTQIAGDNDEESTIYLTNIFNSVKDLPRKTRTEAIQNTVQSMLSSRKETTVNERITGLRLRARSIEETKFRERMWKKEIGSSGVIYGEINMVLELVEDMEQTVSMATQSQLKELELNQEEAYKFAAAALARITDTQQWQSVENCWLSSYRDDYDFARLLVTRSNTRLPFKSGPYVVYAPSHSICLITNKHDAETLSQLISIGNQLSEQHRPLTKRLWTLNDTGNWVPYKNSQSDEIKHIVEMQDVLETSENYDHQKSMLDKEHMDNLDDVFVAKYMVYQNQEKKLFSLCAYTLNLSSLLPKTDYVSVFDHENDNVVGMLLWDDFVEAAGSSMEIVPNLNPKRYALLNKLPEKDYEAITSAATNKNATP